MTLRNFVNFVYYFFSHFLQKKLVKFNLSLLFVMSFITYKLIHRALRFNINKFSRASLKERFWFLNLRLLWSQMQRILIKCTKIIVCLMSNWPTNENCVILNYGHYHTIFDRCQKRAKRSFCVTCPAASRHFVFQSISMFLALRQYNLAKCKRMAV